MSTLSTSPSPWSGRWQRFSAASVRAFHAYAGWLVGISWKRFFLLSFALVVAAAILGPAAVQAGATPRRSRWPRAG